MHQADSSDGLGWPEAFESPNLILCTWAIEGGREGSFIYLLSLIAFALTMVELGRCNKGHLAYEV